MNPEFESRELVAKAPIEMPSIEKGDWYLRVMSRGQYADVYEGEVLPSDIIEIRKSNGERWMKDAEWAWSKVTS